MFEAANTVDIAAQIRKRFDECNVGYAFGSLAAGADILCAEIAFRNAAHAFTSSSRSSVRNSATSPVTRFGTSWGKRFDAVLAAAATIRYATEDAYLGDDTLFSYTSRLAMGLALLQAQFLDGDVFQLAITDDTSGGSTITGGDMAVWVGHR